VQVGRPAAALVLLAAGACSGAPKAAAPVPVVSVASYSPHINPFPVVDSAGRALDLAFLGGFNQPRPQLLDVNGDGKLDLMLQEYTNQLIYLERDGTTADSLPQFLVRSLHYAGLKVGEWSRFADMDGDGKVDVLAEWPSSYIRYFRNVGSPTAPRFEAAPDTVRDAQGTALFADRQNIPQVGDIDCDGIPDLLVGRITGIILEYISQKPAIPAPTFKLITDRFQDLEIITGQGSMHGANTMALHDYDSDGDLDLFWGDFFEAGLLLFENTGTCAEPKMPQHGVRFPPQNPVVTSGYNAPAFGDLNDDGRSDLLVGVIGGAFDPNRTTIANLLYLTRDAAGRYRERTRQLLPMIDVGSESMPTLVDLDGDRDLDLLLANKIDPADRKTSRVYRFENTGDAQRPSFKLAGAMDFRGLYHYAPAFGDLDGDDKLDIIMGSFSAKMAWYRSDGTGASPHFSIVDSVLVEITRGSNATPALGDVDGDGDLDLFVGEASGTLNFYRNDGGPSRPMFVLMSDVYDSIDVGRRSAPALADIDGDGDLDLFVGSDDRGIVLFRNQGTKSEPRFVEDTAFAVAVPPLASPSFGDLDGDGQLELIVGNTGGGAVYLNSGKR
jgi:hypothetical protein